MSAPHSDAASRSSQVRENRLHIIVVLDLVQDRLDLLHLLFREFDGLGRQALQAAFRRNDAGGFHRLAQAGKRAILADDRDHALIHGELFQPGVYQLEFEFFQIAAGGHGELDDRLAVEHEIELAAIHELAAVLVEDDFELEKLIGIYMNMN